MLNKMKVFWIVIVFGLSISSAYAFTVLEVTEPEGYTSFAENENILTWGKNNILGEGATISYSIATSYSSCFMGFEACSSLDSFMPSGYQNVIESAFDRWASVANLSFTQVDDQAGDIVLAGEYIWGSEIAHALTGRSFIEQEGETFSAIAWSEIHFSEGVYWSVNGSLGYDFLTAWRKSRGLAPELDSLQWGSFPIVDYSAYGVTEKYTSCIPKYRHKVFKEPYRAILKGIIQKIGYDYDIDIVELEIPEDHI
ncbi:MAG: transposase, partial [Gammaproteobacteria bacterium]|nr:transposase [Gammaproteobacteria bacterium]